MNTFDINKIQLSIQSPHFKVNDEMHNYILSEVEKLGKTYNRIEKCEINLRVIANNTVDNGEVEAKLFVPGNVLFASVKNSDFKLASKQVFADLKEQLSKFKEKISENSF